MAKLASRFHKTRLITSSTDKLTLQLTLKMIWLRLSKHQSSATVLLKTTLIRTITQCELHCVVFLACARYFSPPRCINGYRRVLVGNYNSAMHGLASHSGRSKNTPSRKCLYATENGINSRLMSHLARIVCRFYPPTDKLVYVAPLQNQCF